jgi:hypothetical protein
MGIGQSDLQGVPVSVIDHRGYGVTRTRPEVLLMVRDAAQRHVHVGAPIDELRAALNALATVARRDDLPPERLLVELKQALNEVPALAGLEPLARSDILASVILRAIEAYYGE